MQNSSVKKMLLKNSKVLFLYRYRSITTVPFKNAKDILILVLNKQRFTPWIPKIYANINNMSHSLHGSIIRQETCFLRVRWKIVENKFSSFHYILCTQPSMVWYAYKISEAISKIKNLHNKNFTTEKFLVFQVPLLIF